jgi:sugar phosphate isomerase/epimerase
VAVDGAHIYEDSPEKRRANRAMAYRWLDIAAQFGAKQLRIDAGGPKEMPDDVFEIIVEGYNDLITRAGEKGIEILFENHWGPTRTPENVVKLLETVDSLGLLLDTNNFEPGTVEKGWEMCARYARSVHIKTFSFDDNGDDPSVNLGRAINLLLDAGYDDVWGIESVPRDGDEYGAIGKTRALIERVVSSRK